MISKCGFRFLVAALAAVALLAFAQPALAQSYSDSFEGTTFNSWWQVVHAPSLSTAQFHTGSQSLQSVPDSYNALGHTFSGPVRGDFSVWVYDDPNTAPSTHYVYEGLRFADVPSGEPESASAKIELGTYGYEAWGSPDGGVTSISCDLGPRASSAEWRKLRAIVGDAGITFQVENASGVLNACTRPFLAALTNLELENDNEQSSRPPIPYFYMDDFSYTAPATAYTVSLLYDPLKAAKSGSTVPIKLQLLRGAVNVSAPSLVVHAVAVLKMDSSVPGQVDDPGNANPDFDFRYDPTLGGTGGYIFNLKTTGLTTGTYHLKFSVNGLGDYTAPFAVK
jgi:hypothetical protein